MPRRILLINGANLNLLGAREPEIYGTTTLNDVIVAAEKQAEKLGVALEVFQSNHEGAIVDRIQEAGGFASLVKSPRAGNTDHQRVDVIIINPGGFTHTSVVIRDALLGVSIPFIEVHVSNLHSREPWRSHSYYSDKAAAVIAGLGAFGYTAALEFAAKHLQIGKK
ncbi:catabolic 3-dehydroquinase [Ophiostoma piceae UAMH 11346]|uniref:Catabolic 3-dehydroquinase n=1 Tax=Ophiostoma piceae (strain UAMH 11346) TaxID=1262450 RepID=S3BSS2_OPHP1|nr:catabolic 3-dehydroquinase [Ophiostoma piceae UAMH 11346]